MRIKVRKSEEKEMEKRVHRITHGADKMSLSTVLPLVIFFVICGILLIWLDNVVLTVASYALAGILAIWGIWSLTGYFRSSTAQRIAGVKMASGLIMLLIAFLIAFNPTYLSGTFPVLWSLALIFGGFLKIQFAFDEKSVQIRHWWIMLIFSAVSIIIGTLAFLRPGFFGPRMELAIGVMMLIEAALDLTTFFLLNHGMKKQTVVSQAELAAALKAADAAAAQPEQPVQPAQPAQPAQPQKEA
jgi:uncharacterized membrane protein HdeD (DUF308 family)